MLPLPRAVALGARSRAKDSTSTSWRNYAGCFLQAVRFLRAACLWKERNAFKELSEGRRFHPSHGGAYGWVWSGKVWWGLVWCGRVWYGEYAVGWQERRKGRDTSAAKTDAPLFAFLWDGESLLASRSVRHPDNRVLLSDDLSDDPRTREDDVRCVGI